MPASIHTNTYIYIYIYIYAAVLWEFFGLVQYPPIYCTASRARAPLCFSCGGTAASSEIGAHTRA